MYSAPKGRWEQSTAWVTENKAAIEAHNKRIEECGTLIMSIWLNR